MEKYNKQKCEISIDDFNKMVGIIEKLHDLVKEKTDYHTIVIDKFNPITNSCTMETISLDEIKKFNLEISTEINEKIY